MIRNVAPDDSNFPRWIRSAALAINALIRPTSVFFDPGAEPSNPTEGQTYHDSTTHKLRTYDGTVWRDHW